MKSINYCLFLFLITVLNSGIFSGKPNDGKESRSGILTSFTANYINKTKDHFLKEMFGRLVQTTRVEIGDVVLRDTEL
jgi:hypothetical protein